MTSATDPRYDRLVAHLERLEPGRAYSLRAWVDAHWPQIAVAPGSRHNHHTWPGGFLDHTLQLLEAADVLLAGLPSVHDLPDDVTPTAVKTVLLLHDVEKPFKYTDGLPDAWSKEDYLATGIRQWGLQLSPAELKAVRHAHGELDDYNAHGRAMDPLGAVVHACDVISARAWHDRGPPKNAAGPTSAA